jgi:hypothetical protein
MDLSNGDRRRRLTYFLCQDELNSETEQCGGIQGVTMPGGRWATPSIVRVQPRQAA